MEVMLKCFVTVMFQMSKLGKLIHFFFRESWSVLLKFVRVYSISHCIRMMDIAGGSKSIAIVLPLIFFLLLKQGRGNAIHTACACLFHMSHLKRDLYIVSFITTVAKMCGSNKVNQ